MWHFKIRGGLKSVAVFNYAAFFNFEQQIVAKVEMFWYSRQKSPTPGLEFGQFEGKASWPWLLKIIRGHRGQYAGHQGHWYLKQF